MGTTTRCKTEPSSCARARVCARWSRIAVNGRARGVEVRCCTASMGVRCGCVTLALQRLRGGVLSLYSHGVSLPRHATTRQSPVLASTPCASQSRQCTLSGRRSSPGASHGRGAVSRAVSPSQIDGTTCTLTKHRSRSIRVSLHTQHIFLPVLSASGPAAAGAGAGAAAAAAAEKANVNGELDLARNPEGTRNRTSCRCPLLPWPQFHISTTPVALLQPSIRTTTRPLPANQANRRRFVNEHW